MDAELMTLASSGASTLVGLMVSDGWAQTKTRVASLFGGHSSGQADVMAAELGSAQAEMVRARDHADELAMADLEAEWRSRFRRLLASNPQAAIELRQLLNELNAGEPKPGRTSTGAIEMSAKAADHGRVYQVGHGDMYIGDE